MRIISEKRLRNFGFWGGAEDSANKLTTKQLDEIEEKIEVDYPEGITEDELNDKFRFEFDDVCTWVGYANEFALDFCKEFGDERIIELNGEEICLTVEHNENYTTISDDTYFEEMDVEKGMTVDGAIAAYKNMLYATEDVD